MAGKNKYEPEHEAPEQHKYSWYYSGNMAAAKLHKVKNTRDDYSEYHDEDPEDHRVLSTQEEACSFYLHLGACQEAHEHMNYKEQLHPQDYQVNLCKKQT